MPHFTAQNTRNAGYSEAELAALNAEFDRRAASAQGSGPALEAEVLDNIGRAVRSDFPPGGPVPPNPPPG